MYNWNESQGQQAQANNAIMGHEENKAIQPDEEGPDESTNPKKSETPEGEKRDQLEMAEANRENPNKDAAPDKPEMPRQRREGKDPKSDIYEANRVKFHQPNHHQVNKAPDNSKRPNPSRERPNRGASSIKVEPTCSRRKKGEGYTGHTNKLQGQDGQEDRAIPPYKEGPDKGAAPTN